MILSGAWSRSLGICGSLRKASLNRALLRAVGETLPAGSTMSCSRRARAADLQQRSSPSRPRSRELKAAIAAADGVVFAVPEYNYSIPGGLKNALDWVSRPPAAVTAARQAGRDGRRGERDERHDPGADPPASHPRLTATRRA